MKITEVRAITCDVPLSRPIILGEIRYDARDYLMVEVRTDEGLSGIGFGNARRAPLAEIVVNNLAPLLLGHDPALIERLWDRMYYSNLLIGQRGLFMRALSAVDIALWDLKGKVAGMPVWQLLGGFRDRVPALMAGGYPAAGKDADDLQREVADYIARGFRKVKIAAEDLAADTSRLEAARASSPDFQLMYDAHWSWRDIAKLLPVVRRWEALELDWIEDPFPSELTGLTARLHDQIHIPLALGEDLAGRWAFRDLLHQGTADVIRVDATSAGGLSEAVRICALAGVEGLPVSPHSFPEVHVHLGAGLSQVNVVEVTDPPQEINLLHRLLLSRLDIQNGEVLAPSSPGLGVEVNWTAVAQYGGTVLKRQ
jgi:D-arabinonate dehydratase